MAPLTVSFVVPTLNEADHLPAALDSIRALDAAVEYEVIVADGGSADGTREIARAGGARVVTADERGIGAGRNAGARVADGEWLAFVDADTTVRERYVDRMLRFAERAGVAAASSRCRVGDVRRGKAMQVVVNRVFPHLRLPVLPGFNTFVRRSAYDAVGGYPNVGNEDTAFSRALARRFDTGYCPDVLVETSGRRFAELGLTGALAHYLRHDLDRVLAGH